MAKVIELKQLGEEKENGALNYKDLIQVIMQTPADPQKGLSVEEIRQSVRVLDALDKAKDSLELEDADYNNLKQRVEGYRFGFAHKNIVTFVDDIINAKTKK